MADLNKNELEAMRILWSGPELKPAEIQDRFTWSIENATLRSVLAQLVEKRLVSRRRRGKAFFYRARAARETLLSTMTRRMAQVFTGGSTADLIAQLIKIEKLSPEEIAELRSAAAEKPGQTPNPATKNALDENKGGRP
jgi:BlaI family transcriptional regulator, penicillinase repressor